MRLTFNVVRVGVGSKQKQSKQAKLPPLVQRASVPCVVGVLANIGHGGRRSWVVTGLNGLGNSWKSRVIMAMNNTVGTNRRQQ